MFTLCHDYPELSNDFQFVKEVVDTQVTSFVSKYTYDEEENPFTNIHPESLTLEEKVDFWIDAIDRNWLLEEKEKEIAYSLEKYICANPYINYEDAYNRFATVSITNIPFRNGRVSALYDRSSNVIKNYNCYRKEQERFQMDMTHEFVHITGHLDNVMLNEGMTSLICHEFYDGNYEDGYNRHPVMCKILCELIDSDTMLEAYSKHDMSIIENALYRIYPDKDYNTQFLNLLDSYARCQRVDVVEEFVIKEKVNEIVEYLNGYLRRAYISKDTKKAILYYYYVPFLLDTYGVSPKTYFSTSINNYQKVK